MANANVSAAVDALTALRGEAQGGVGVFSLPAAAVSFPYSKVDEPGQGRGKMVPEGKGIFPADPHMTAMLDLVLQLSAVAEEGAGYSRMLYTYRNAACAIPPLSLPEELRERRSAAQAALDEASEAVREAQRAGSKPSEAALAQQAAAIEEKRPIDAEVKAFEGSLNRVTVDTLLPRVRRVMNMVQFLRNAASATANALASIAPRKHRVVPTAVYLNLAHIFSNFVVMEVLKGMKGAVLNELSTLRKAMAACPDLAPEENCAGELDGLGKDLPGMGFFLALLREQVYAFTGVVKDDALAAVTALVNFILGALAGGPGAPVLQADRYALVLAMAMGLLVLDQPTGAQFVPHTAALNTNLPQVENPKKDGSILTSKAFNVSTAAAVLKAHPVVPIFGDLALQPRFVLRNLLSLQLWPEETEAFLGSPVERRSALEAMLLPGKWAAMRTQHVQVMTQLARAVARVKAEQPLTDSKRVYIHSGTDTGAGAANTSTGHGSLKVRPGHEMEDGAPDAGAVGEAWKAVHAVLTALGGWTDSVLAQSAAKFQLQAGGGGGSSFAFERATRENYSPEELTVLLDFVTAIKTTASAVQEACPLLDPVLRYEAHSRVQYFVHGLVTDQLTKAVRSGDKYMEGVLLDLRSVAAEWLSAFQESRGDTSRQESEYLTAAQSRKQHSTKGTEPKGVPPGRLVGPGTAQRVALQAFIEAIVDPTSKFSASGSMFSAKLIRAEKVARMRAFAANLDTYPHLLNASGTALALQRSLASLWFREMHLSIDKRVQFPLRTSMPWMVTKHALEVGAPHAAASALHALDLYNDAAAYALHNARTAHLFAEIEAEAAMALEQFVQHAATSIYTTAKVAAARSTISGEAAAVWDEHLATLAGAGGRWGGVFGADEPTSTQPEAVGMGALPRHSLQQQACGLEYLLQEHAVPLVGRVPVDVGREIMRTILANHLRPDLDRLVRAVEDDAPEGIADYATGLSILQAAHASLSTHAVGLPPWQVLVVEAEGSEGGGGVSLLTSRSRLFSALLIYLVDDVVPNYVWNAVTNRFVRAKGFTPAARKARDRGQRPDTHRRYYAMLPEPLAEVMVAATTSRRAFLGPTHARAIVRLLSVQQLAVLSEQLTRQVACEVARSRLGRDVFAILQALPPTSLPDYAIGAGMQLQVMRERLKNLVSWPALRPRVFQNLREMGNALALLHLLGSALHRADMNTFLTMGPLALPPSVAKGSLGLAAVGGADGALAADRSSVLAPMEITAAAAHVADRAAARVLGSCAGPALPADAATAASVLGSTKFDVPLLTEALVAVGQALYEEGVDGQPSVAAGAGSDPLASAEERVVSFGLGGYSDSWHRVWSALLAVSVFSGIAGVAGVRDRDLGEFGHGLLLAGAAVTVLLNQEGIWAQCDLVSHLLRCMQRDAALQHVAEAGETAGVAPAQTLQAAGLPPALPGSETALTDIRTLAPVTLHTFEELVLLVRGALPRPFSAVVPAGVQGSEGLSALDAPPLMHMRFAPPRSLPDLPSVGVAPVDTVRESARMHVHSTISRG